MGKNDIVRGVFRVLHARFVGRNLHTGTRSVDVSSKPLTQKTTSSSLADLTKYVALVAPQSNQGQQVRQASLAALPADAYRPSEYFAYGTSRSAGRGVLSHKALLVDACGTLLEATEPVTKAYLDIGRKYGVKYDEATILARYRWAFAQPWSHSYLRYVDDARPYWQYIISQSTGCCHPDYFEELYQYYSTAAAWKLADPRAELAFAALRRAGVKLAVVSNFDTRLRPIMRALQCDTWFDVIAVSAEMQVEKPNPCIFHNACELLGVEPREAVHVGDDRRNDIWGARDAGCDAWLWGDDVHSFAEIAENIGVSLSGQKSHHQFVSDCL